jgi:hypothetical protein
MYTTFRIIAIAGVLAATSVAWMFLSAATTARTGEQGSKLGPEVQTLWGQPQVQTPPVATVTWSTAEKDEETVVEKGKERKVLKTRFVSHQRDVPAALTQIRAGLHLDHRLRGLLWYALYDVTFDGAWTYTYEGTEAGELHLEHAFPVPDAIYDDFQFIVDGRDFGHEVRLENGKVGARVPVSPGQTVTLQVRYRSRGLDRWAYAPSGAGVASLQNFTLQVACDFDDIDFPADGMSPSRRQRTADGWLLSWNFKQVLTGRAMGLTMPARLQPGELAATLAASAPVSLLLFFIVLFVLSVRYSLDVHPLNYLGIAAAFFAFHLLFAYSVDHLNVVLAFALASAASIFLVVSYLRLVVSPRFAYRKAALAQLVYQVGFSIAHFWKGYTGLTISVLATLTLFLVMQWTGRTRWTDVLRGRDPTRPTPPAPVPANGATAVAAALAAGGRE